MFPWTVVIILTACFVKFSCNTSIQEGFGQGNWAKTNTDISLTPLFDSAIPQPGSYFVEEGGIFTHFFDDYAVLWGGKVFLTSASDQYYSTDLWYYSYSSGSWEFILGPRGRYNVSNGLYPNGRKNPGYSVDHINKRIYIVGGESANGFYRDIWVYSHETKEWKLLYGTLNSNDDMFFNPIVWGRYKENNENNYELVIFAGGNVLSDLDREWNLHTLETDKNLENVKFASIDKFKVKLNSTGFQGSKTTYTYNFNRDFNYIDLYIGNQYYIDWHKVLELNDSRMPYKFNDDLKNYDNFPQRICKFFPIDFQPTTSLFWLGNGKITIVGGVDSMVEEIISVGENYDAYKSQLESTKPLGVAYKISGNFLRGDVFTIDMLVLGGVSSNPRYPSAPIADNMYHFSFKGRRYSFGRWLLSAFFGSYVPNIFVAPLFITWAFFQISVVVIGCAIMPHCWPYIGMCYIFPMVLWYLLGLTMIIPIRLYQVGAKLFWKTTCGRCGGLVRGLCIEKEFRKLENEKDSGSDSSNDIIDDDNVIPVKVGVGLFWKGLVFIKKVVCFSPGFLPKISSIWDFAKIHRSIGYLFLILFGVFFISMGYLVDSTTSPPSFDSTRPTAFEYTVVYTVWLYLLIDVSYPLIEAMVSWIPCTENLICPGPSHSIDGYMKVNNCLEMVIVFIANELVFSLFFAGVPAYFAALIPMGFKALVIFITFDNVLIECWNNSFTDDSLCCILDVFHILRFPCYVVNCCLCVVQDTCCCAFPRFLVDNLVIVTSILVDITLFGLVIAFSIVGVRKYELGYEDVSRQPMEQMMSAIFWLLLSSGVLNLYFVLSESFSSEAGDASFMPFPSNSAKIGKGVKKKKRKMLTYINKRSNGNVFCQIIEYIFFCVGCIRVFPDRLMGCIAQSMEVSLLWKEVIQTILMILIFLLNVSFLGSTGMLDLTTCLLGPLCCPHMLSIDPVVFFFYFILPAMFYAFPVFCIFDCCCICPRNSKNCYFFCRNYNLCCDSMKSCWDFGVIFSRYKAYKEYKNNQKFESASDRSRNDIELAGVPDTVVETYTDTTSDFSTGGMTGVDIFVPTQPLPNLPVHTDGTFVTNDFSARMNVPTQALPNLPVQSSTTDEISDYSHGMNGEGDNGVADMGIQGGEMGEILDDIDGQNVFDSSSFEDKEDD